MSFEHRNAAWAGGPRFFRQLHSRTAVRAWYIDVRGNQIVTSWGLLGGAMQEATESCQGVNVGKSNEKTPAQYAVERAREMCRKKNREGYREFSSAAGDPVDPPVVAEIDFDALPESLCFYKPDNKMGAGMLKKAKAGEVIYTRKRNGLAFIIARGSGSAMLYSRRMLRQHDDEIGTEWTWDHRFPHIVEGANSFMPPSSLVLGELTMDRNGVDDFKHVQSITKSLTQQSIADQAKNGYPSFYIWDIGFWDGARLVADAKVKERYELIHEIELPVSSGGIRSFLPIELFPEGFFKTPEDAVEYAKLKEWEGFVVVDPEATYDDRAFNFKGKPDRPGSACSKLKPSFEDDFVAMWDPDKKIGERSTKERYGQGIKSVALFQYDKKGELVFISNISSGLTEEQKTALAKPELWPKVWKVEYDSRTYISDGDDTNALTFARFEAERTDKRPEECVNEEL